MYVSLSNCLRGDGPFRYGICGWIRSAKLMSDRAVLAYVKNCDIDSKVSSAFSDSDQESEVERDILY